MIIAKKTSYKQKLFMEGNSLMNWSVNHGVINGRYVSTGIYNSVRSGRTLALYDYGTSSQNQTQINAAIASRITPYLNPGDVIFLWEGTNDMFTNALSGAAAYANLVTYSETVRALGAILVIGTVIARDYVSDRADLMTDIDAYNTLVRDNQATICDGLVDLALRAEFNARADASNTTYYNADKLHIATAGQNLVITDVAAGLELVLS